MVKFNCKLSDRDYMKVHHTMSGSVSFTSFVRKLEEPVVLTEEAAKELVVYLCKTLKIQVKSVPATVEVEDI